MSAPAPSPYRSWRAKKTSQAASPELRRVQRLLLSALALGLLTVFGWLIYRLLPHPWTAQVVAIPIVEYRVLGAPPLAFIEEDMQALQGLGTSVRLERNLQESSALEGVGVRQVIDRNADVAIFYVSGHGVSEDGTAYLLSSDYRPSDDWGRYPLGKLLRQISAAPAKLKLLILDAGRITHDARLGMLVNEFPRLLVAEVQAVNDPALWVLASHAPLESSQVSSASRRSVFGFFVAEGLSGQADGYGGAKRDDKVDLREFAGFVRDHVAAWLARSTGGTVSQTPLLSQAVSNPKEPTSDLVLLRVPQPAAAQTKAAEAAADTPPEKSEPTGSAPESAKQGDAKTTPLKADSATGQPAANPPPPSPPGQPAAATSGAVKPQEDKPVAAPAQAAASDTASSKNPSEEQKPSTPAETKAAPTPPQATTTAPEGQESEPPAAGGKPAADPLSALAGLTLADSSREGVREFLRRAWQLRDELEDRRRDRPWSPVDDMPHVWREFQEKLLGYELLHRGGSAFEARVARDLARAIQESVAKLRRPPAESLLADVARQGRESIQSRIDETFGSQPADAQVRETVSLVLEVERLAEQATTHHPWARPWVEELVNRADTRRLQGERDLLSSAAAAKLKLANAALQDAKSGYASARERLQLLQQAVALKNDLLFRLPYYVAWRGRASLAGGGDVPPHDELRRLIEELPPFVALLQREDPETVDDILKRTDDLERLRRNLEAALQDKAIGPLVESPTVPGNAQKIEALLSTPLPRADRRMRLLDALAKTPALDSAEMRDAQPASPGGRRDEALRQALRQAELDAALARAARPAPSSDPSAGLLDALARAQQQFLSAPTNSVAEDNLWKSYRALGRDLKQFYRDLPSRLAGELGRNADLSDPSTRDNRLRALQSLEIPLMFADARDVASEAWRIEDNPLQHVRAAQRYNLLRWHHDRLLSALRTSSPAEAIAQEEFTFLAQSVRSLRDAATGIPGQAALSDDAHPIAEPLPDVRGVELLHLLQGTSQLLNLSLEGRLPQKAWVALDYDPAVINVRTAEGRIVDPGDPQALTKDTWSYSLQPAGDTALDQTRLVVRLIAGGRPFLSRSYVVPVALPTLHLRVESQPARRGTWTSGPAGLALRPFPNQGTAYRFSLVNRSGRPKKAQVKLLAVPVPPESQQRWNTLPPLDEKAIWAKAPILAEAEVDLPDNKPRPIALKKPPPPAPTPAAPEPKPKPPDGPPPAPPKTAVGHGLAFVLTEDGKSVVKWVKIPRPLRPREYLDPEVRYDPNEHTVRVQVKPSGPDRLPPKGSVVRLQFPPEQDALVIGRREQVELKPPQSKDELWAKIAPSAAADADDLTLYLNVDGDPRAFVYRVDFDSDRAIPPQTDLHEIRILQPPPEMALPVPAADASPQAAAKLEIPLHLQADAPLDAFAEGSADSVDVEMSLERDGRTLQTRRFGYDRQVQVFLDEITDDGLVQLSSKLDDFAFALPAEGLRDERVAIVARLKVGADAAESPRRRIAIDGSPPEIGRITTRPAVAIPRGAILEVAAAVRDNLSGVKAAEIFLDAEDTGKFDDAKAVRVEPDTGGVARASFPIKELEVGKQLRILVRATDGAGNRSAVSRSGALRVAEPEPPSIRGRVVWKGRVVGTVKVRLLSADGKKVLRATEADEKGAYAFARVAPGGYLIQADGRIIRMNMEIPQSGQAEVTVQPPNQPEVPDVILQP